MRQICDALDIAVAYEVWPTSEQASARPGPVKWCMGRGPSSTVTATTTATASVENGAVFDVAADQQPAATRPEQLTTGSERSCERIPWPLTLASDLGKRPAQRLALDT